METIGTGQNLGVGTDFNLGFGLDAQSTAYQDAKPK